MNTSIETKLEINSECPFCHSKTSHTWAMGRDFWMQITKLTFEYVKCDGCGCVYMKNRPAEKDIGNYYSDEYEPYLAAPRKHGNSFLFRVYSRIMNKLNSKFRSHELNRASSSFYNSIGKKDTFVDFGCGSGVFLKTISPKSSKAIGVDFSPIAIKSIKELGLEAYEVDKFWKEIPDQSVNYIRLNHVAEHLYNPDEVFSAINSKLASGGKLHLAVPNPEGFSARFFGKFWYGLECPRHIAIPTPKSLKILLENNKFGKITVVQESITKDFVRSIGFVLASAGFIKFTTANALIDNKTLDLIFGFPFKILSGFGLGDRFHIFCEKIESEA